MEWDGDKVKRYPLQKEHFHQLTAGAQAAGGIFLSNFDSGYSGCDSRRSRDTSILVCIRTKGKDKRGTER